MESTAMKSDFRKAYEAGKQEVEHRVSPVWAIPLAAILVAMVEVCKRLAVHFQLSRLEGILLQGLAYFIVFSVYLFWSWGRIKRNKT